MSKGLAFAVIDFFFLLRSYIFDFRSVCVCIYFWLLCHDWRNENEEESFYPSRLVAEGMNASKHMGDSESLALMR